MCHEFIRTQGYRCILELFILRIGHSGISRSNDIDEFAVKYGLLEDQLKVDELLVQDHVGSDHENAHRADRNDVW